jgi:hypothetical protein
MAAHFRDASAEQQVSAWIVKKDVAGGFCSKARGFAPARIRDRHHPGDLRRALPQVGVCPIPGSFVRHEKHDSRRDRAVASGEQPVELFHTRAGAGAFRVRKHDQCRTSSIEKDGCAVRRVIGGDANRTGLDVLAGNGSESAGHDREPQKMYDKLVRYA